MGRAKRGKIIKKQTKNEEDYSGDDGPNPESDDFFHDEVGKFHKDREKIMLEEENKSDEEESDEDIENIMGLDLEESDDNDDDESEDESDEESKLPSDMSWGKKKSTFYSADTGDADIGSDDEEAWELEKQEEEAALVLQKRMAAALDEEDFDVANFEIPVDEEKDEEERKDKKTVAMDLSKLSKEQKLEILFRDSPELFELLEEFKEKLEEVTMVLSPLINLAKLGKLPLEGAKYLELKHQLYLNYCINIGFYLLMKARQTPVKGHPVIERIVQYRTLIKELEPLDKELESDIKTLLANKSTILYSHSDNVTKDQTKEDSKQSDKNKILKKKKKRTLKTKSKLSALLDESEEENVEEKADEPPKKKPKKKKNTEEYSDPLEYYEKVRLEKKKAKEMKNLAARLAHEPDGLNELDVEGNEDTKRAITYQISKNKGLTARKKKQERNPRVKHRKKYTKAVIKHKSQVRPVINEATRYGGEKSGIRAFLTRSVKIK